MVEVAWSAIGSTNVEFLGVSSLELVGYQFPDICDPASTLPQPSLTSTLPRLPLTLHITSTISYTSHNLNQHSGSRLPQPSLTSTLPRLSLPEPSLTSTLPQQSLTYHNHHSQSPLHTTSTITHYRHSPPHYLNQHSRHQIN